MESQSSKDLKVNAAFTDEHTETRDGCRIAFGRMGHADAGGPRIVLVHALAMNRFFWQEVAERLIDTTAMLAIDCRGAGQSGKPVAAYTVEQFADDIADVLDHVSWQDAFIAGASMGGCVSLAFAARYPQRALGLGLIDTTAWYGPEAAKAWAERAAKAELGGMAALIDFQLARWFSDAFREAQAERVQRAVDIFLCNDVTAYAATCQMLGAYDMRAALARLTLPTRILVGEEDYATPVAMAQALHQGIKSSTLRVLTGVRHFSPLEVPDVIAAELSQLAKGR